MPQDGISSASRQRLTALITHSGPTFTVGETAAILELPREAAAKMLARWAAQGWLKRIRRGRYMPVPVESDPMGTVPEDPWILTATSFAPCYVGGWSAAEHWGLTEQMFRTIVVFSAKPPRDRRVELAGTPFWILGTRSERMLFGLKSVWRGHVRVQVSNHTRTVLDMLDNPLVGGGLRPMADVVRAYLESESFNYSELEEYAGLLGNGAVYKRLGYLLERLCPDRTSLLALCRKHLTSGLARLDPTIDGDRIVKRWRIRVPRAWSKVAPR